MRTLPSTPQRREVAPGRQHRTHPQSWSPRSSSPRPASSLQFLPDSPVLSDVPAMWLLGRSGPAGTASLPSPRAGLPLERSEPTLEAECWRDGHPLVPPLDLHLRLLEKIPINPAIAPPLPWAGSVGGSGEAGPQGALGSAPSLPSAGLTCIFSFPFKGHMPQREPAALLNA